MKLNDLMLKLSRPDNSDPIRDFFVADRPVEFVQTNGTVTDRVMVRFKPDGTIQVILQ